MAIVHYREDGITPLDGFAITNEEAGADSDVIPFIAKNDGVAAALNYIPLQRTVSPTNPDIRLAVGAPPQDDQWGRIRVVGFDNTADPTWSTPVTDWFPAGAYSSGPMVPTIPPDCWVELEYKSRPPSIAEVATWTRALVPLYDEYSQPVPAALTRFERGVLHGIGDGTRSGVVSVSLEASGTPDDKVILRAYWLRRGKLYGIISELTFDDEDGASVALTSGTSYWATVSGGAGTVTVTEGLKTASPTKPQAPAGEPVLGYVKVEYQAGGVPVIETADLDFADIVLDRYAAEAGAGTTLRISGGQALGGGSWRFAGGVQEIVLEDDETSWVWQLVTGYFAATTDEEPPQLTALLLCEVDTASGAITEIRDRRKYAGGTEVLRLRGDLDAAPGPVLGPFAELVVGHEHLVMDIGAIYRASDNGGGSAGLTKLDVLVNGASIFTNAAVVDTRPAFDFDASAGELTIDTPHHEVTELRRGDVVSLVSVTHPTGGTPDWAEAMLVCRVP